jgi:probable AcnD-accessory protein PrpF
LAGLPADAFNPRLNSRTRDQTNTDPTMPHTPQIKIPATYMRGGTSKGVFFRLDDLPDAARTPGPARDALLMRVIGSPDPYAKQIDGMGGATSSTSKTVIVARSTRPEHDVDYLFGQVAIDKPFVDWSGNCGNLSSAVGPFAIAASLIDPERVPRDGVAVVRIWQANIGKTIIAHVPMTDGEVQETGDFELDGVTFPAAEVQLDFLDPAAEEEGSEGGSAMFPTGNLVDELDVPGVGTLRATMINAGIPTIFIEAAAVGYDGTELQDAVNGDPRALAMFETIRAHGAVRMGLIERVEDAAKRQHTPKVAFVARAANYVTSSGRQVAAGEIDLLVRALSMGKLHHAMMGTAAVAIGTAAAIPGTLVSLAAGGGARDAVRFGHPSGTLRVGAQARKIDGAWVVAKASMSRSARVLMEGWVRVPGDAF